MTQGKNQTTLQVLEGEGRRSLGVSSPLTAVRERAGVAPAQLGLPGVSPPRDALICVTVAVLTSQKFDRRVTDLGVRKLVDLRVAPSFLRLGLRRAAFVERIGELGVDYLHLAALANRFAGESWHTERYRQRLERHYDENSDAVTRLRELVEVGPIMLLVAESSELEREVLLGALERVSSGFEVQVLGGG